MTKKIKHPMQPIVYDEHGVIRFKQNSIIDYLFKTRKLDLNELAMMDFPAEDRMQIAQLLGYSVSGYGDLPYVTPKNLEEADAKAEELREDNEQRASSV
jgi:hypothetical protein